MSDENEVIEETSPVDEAEELEDGAEEVEGAAAETKQVPRQDKESSTLELVLNLEQCEKTSERLAATAEEKRIAVITVEGHIAATTAELAQIDALEELDLPTVQKMENLKRKAKRLESEREAATANLEAATVELSAANKALTLAELAEAEDRLRRLSDSVGSTVLIFSKHLRALCEETLSFSQEVEASTPFGHKLATLPGFPFRSIQSPNLPECPGAGYPASEAVETERFLKWLIDVVRLTGGNGPADERAYWHRWAAASPILPREEFDGQPN